MMTKSETRRPSSGQQETPPLQASLPAAAPAALLQAQTFGKLLVESMGRLAGNGTATAAVLPLALRADSGAELLDLHLAAWQRFGQLQHGWMQGWSLWFNECAQLRQASTLSEHLEQQYNLGEQFTAMLKAQASDLLDLQGNVEVDYGYWVTQKVKAATCAPD
jgi:hypothetical protein